MRPPVALLTIFRGRAKMSDSVANSTPEVRRRKSVASTYKLWAAALGAIGGLHPPLATRKISWDTHSK